jgi:hypothetical protein
MADPRLTSEQKASVAQRARYCCEYCLSQVHYAPDPFAVDHIVPRALGGANDLSNLAYACLGCNGRKFTRTTATDPATGEIAPLYSPRLDRWHDHFAWSTDFTLMLGVTPTGRATIERLQLNRDGVVNLRHMLHGLHKHPPDF